MQHPKQKEKYDLIFVGAGILGTFHAYHALKLGLKVALLEKTKMPAGATTQNFGQVVPSGMNTKWQNFGRESLSIYKEIQTQADISVRQNGSVYVASNDEEVRLIEELAAINKSNAYTSQLLTKEECLQKWPGLKSSYCKAGLFFPEEITVNARVAIRRVIQFLISKYELDFYGNTKVIDIHINDAGCEVVDNLRRTFNAEQVILCNGSDFKTLFPNIFWGSDLEVTKLHMLQTMRQSTLRLDGNILTGLTIRRYESFRECPSYAAIKERESDNTFAKEYGIHILFKQLKDGAVIIGDSHEYADAKDQDDLGYEIDNNINRFIMDRAMEIMDLQNWSIEKAWFGIYSQCKENDIFQHSIDDKLHIVTGIGGKGMTGSPAFAKESVYKILKQEEKIHLHD